MSNHYCSIIYKIMNNPNGHFQWHDIVKSAADCQCYNTMENVEQLHSEKLVLAKNWSN